MWFCENSLNAHSQSQASFLLQTLETNLNWQLFPPCLLKKETTTDFILFSLLPSVHAVFLYHSVNGCMCRTHLAGACQESTLASLCHHRAASWIIHSAENSTIIQPINLHTVSFYQCNCDLHCESKRAFSKCRAAVLTWTHNGGGLLISSVKRYLIWAEEITACVWFFLNQLFTKKKQTTTSPRYDYWIFRAMS